MVCPILTAARMAAFKQIGEVAVCKCHEEDCGMWPSCRRWATNQVEWTDDAVVTAITRSEAKGGKD